jgi:hypothetical protein
MTGLCCLIAGSALAGTAKAVRTHSTSVRPVPAVIRHVVAGPRAALAPCPPAVAEDPANICCPMTGAAWNFARDDAAITMKLGTTLRVKLSDQIEGVWYERTCGWLGTVLVLEMKDPAGTSETPWIPLGRDGAADRRCGPSIGRARDVGVSFRPEQIGNYLLRARIFTYALPARPEAPEADVATELQAIPLCAASASDEVFINLRVLRPIDPVPLPEPYAEPISELPRESLSGVIE